MAAKSHSYVWTAVRTVARVLLPYWVVAIAGHIKIHGKLPNIFRPTTLSEKNPVQEYL